MDTAIHTLVTVDRALRPEDVAFFEVDVDADQALAAKWGNEGIPFVVWYWNGTQIKVRDDHSGRVVDGGLCGGMGKAAILATAKTLHAAAKAGHTLVDLA